MWAQQISNRGTHPLPRLNHLQEASPLCLLRMRPFGNSHRLNWRGGRTGSLFRVPAAPPCEYDADREVVTIAVTVSWLSRWGRGSCSVALFRSPKPSRQSCMISVRVLARLSGLRGGPDALTSNRLKGLTIARESVEVKMQIKVQTENEQE